MFDALISRLAIPLTDARSFLDLRNPNEVLTRLLWLAMHCLHPFFRVGVSRVTLLAWTCFPVYHVHSCVVIAGCF